MDLTIIIEWLSKNIEWVFSGIGVAALPALFRACRPSKTRSAALPVSLPHKAAPDMPSTVERVSAIAPREIQSSNDSESARLAKRLQLVLALMNEGSNTRRTTISMLALETGVSTVSEVEDYFSAKQTPTFPYLQTFCESFGVDFEWLANGTMGSPFRAHRRYDTDRYLVTPAKEVVRANPIEVYFVMNRSETAEALIILRYTKFRYEALSDRWHVSSHVGNTGRWQLVGLYKLISELRGSNKFKGQCYGRRLEEKLFYRLSMGEAYPGAILRSTENDHWWDDFTNVDHPKNRSCLYVQCIKRGSDRAASQLNPVT
jgi:hypothetical protein